MKYKIPVRLAAPFSLLLLLALASTPARTAPAGIPDGLNPAGRRIAPTAKPGLVLQVATQTVKKGDVAHLRITNRSRKTYVYNFPGGGDSCSLPIYKISVTTASGLRYITYNSGPRRACLAVIIRPRKIVLKPGQSMTLKLHTGRVLYRPWRPGQRRPKRFFMTPGTYTVTVSGGGLNLSAKLRLMR